MITSSLLRIYGSNSRKVATTRNKNRSTLGDKKENNVARKNGKMSQIKQETKEKVKKSNKFHSFCLDKLFHENTECKVKHS